MARKSKLHRCLLPAILFLCACPIALCQESVVVPGDVFIEGVFSLYENDNGGCGEIDSHAVQSMEAVKWTLNILNNASFIQNNKIGLRVYKTCRNPSRAKEIAFNISSSMRMRTDTVAVLGPGYSSEAGVMSQLFSALPDDLRPLQVGFSTTAESLSNREQYNNFFRVIPSDQVQTESMSKFIKEMIWTYVAIFHDDDIYGNEAVAALQRLLAADDTITCYPLITSVNTALSQSDTLALIRQTLQNITSRSPPVGGIIVIGSGKLGNELFKAMKDVMDSDSTYRPPVMLLSESVFKSLGADAAYENVTKGAFVSSLPKLTINEFRAHWIKLLTANDVVNNVELRQVAEGITKCDLSNSSCSPPTVTDINSHMSDSIYLPYAIQATLVIAEVIKSLYVKTCSNVGTAPCAELRTMPKFKYIEAMANVDVRLGSGRIGQLVDFKNDEGGSLALVMSFPEGATDVRRASNDEPTYVVYNRRKCQNVFCNKKVFEYFSSTGTSNIHKDEIRDYNSTTGQETNYPSIRIPQCPDGFLCSECPPVEVAAMDVVEGDMYVVGVAPIHGMSDSFYKCGKIKAGGLDVAEAIKFTVKKEMESVQFGVKVGTIIIDACNDPQIVLSRVLQLHNQGIYKNGTFSKVKILGYIGGWVSDISITIAETLSTLGYVQISYGSTSPRLSDRSLYPYFMRVVPSDVKQAKIMLEVVKKLGSNVVQVLYSKTAYGTGGKDAILDHAKDFDICVSNVVGVEQMEQMTDEQIMVIKENLTHQHSAKIVMVFLSAFHVEKLISVLNEMNGYIFVASEGWGHRDVISKYTNLGGSITLAHEIQITQLFRDHMKELTPKRSDSPWAQEYMENYFNCYYGWSFNKTVRTSECSPEARFDTCIGSDCYKIETWAPFAGVAVSALLRGANNALKLLCNGVTSTICPNYRNNPKDVTKEIFKIEIAYDQIIQRKVFDDNYDGLITYKRYMIHVKDGKATYDIMESDSSYRWNKSRCDVIGHDVCDKCRQKTSPTMPPPYDNKGDLTSAVIAFVILFVLAAAALVFIAWVWWKKKFCCKGRGETPGRENNKGGYDGEDANYITATYNTNGGYLTASDLDFSSRDSDFTDIIHDDVSPPRSHKSDSSAEGPGVNPAFTKEPTVTSSSGNNYV